MEFHLFSLQPALRHSFAVRRKAKGEKEQPESKIGPSDCVTFISGREEVVDLCTVFPLATLSFCLTTSILDTPWFIFAETRSILAERRYTIR